MAKGGAVSWLGWRLPTEPGSIPAWRQRARRQARQLFRVIRSTRQSAVQYNSVRGGLVAMLGTAAAGHAGELPARRPPEEGPAGEAADRAVLQHRRGPAAADAAQRLPNTQNSSQNNKYGF